ncbi:phytanoyl-CoA dioxygenase family protein [Aliiroseovarius sp. KMU-50]|uniref:Phytanoyl-CoA dioxygenase family protein n=1 Tax=Aliiroseovarius salicola TaxID=3009082 RepID=A0ABT4W436_9RHOB|nr:phytanoyl-CoA dioxygenase family protein [Aliiroseovarius sp. KMU-50]MDA5095240.1 phytanoyl-CoA dioxygenase family protein [Aliiroseovarius sp. KMU-50]
MDPDHYREQLKSEGRVWLRKALTEEELEGLRNLSVMEGRPGARIAHTDPLFQTLPDMGFNELITQTWPNMQQVRLLSFDKSKEANWGVPWHQDRIIELAEKTQVPGYTNWSQKAGIWHCEPPLEQLETMLFVRVHLDRSTVENGAMEIALGSHREGKVSSPRASEIAGTYPTEITTAEAGDVLVLAMLTLHRSGSSATAKESNERRRTLRVDYAPFDLTDGLN